MPDGRRRRLTVEVRARMDIEDALYFTEQQWGREQRRRYRAQLVEATDSLLEYPERGRARDDLYPGCRSLRVGQHVMFYRLDGDDIVIGRVLHVSQDPAGKVTP